MKYIGLIFMFISGLVIERKLRNYIGLMVFYVGVILWIIFY